MFAVIHFNEDNSVSVVGRHNKNLTVNGEFEMGTDVKMIWKVGNDNTEYSGAIVKIGDDETDLTSFANLVYKRYVSENEPVEARKRLLELKGSLPKEKGVSSKRKRKITVTMKESLEQQNAISPKKKKTVCEKKSAKVSAIKKANEIEEKVIFSYLSASKSQFEEVPKQTDTSVTSESAMAAVKSANDVLNANELDNTQNFIDMLNKDNQIEPVEKIPVPPPEVIQLFEALDNPKVKEFIKEFVQHFSSRFDHSQHLCYETEAADHSSIVENSFSTSSFTPLRPFRPTPVYPRVRPAELFGTLGTSYIPQTFDQSVLPYGSLHLSQISQGTGSAPPMIPSTDYSQTFSHSHPELEHEQTNESQQTSFTHSSSQHHEFQSTDLSDDESSQQSPSLISGNKACFGSTQDRYSTIKKQRPIDRLKKFESTETENYDETQYSPSILSTDFAGIQSPGGVSRKTSKPTSPQKKHHQVPPSKPAHVDNDEEERTSACTSDKVPMTKPQQQVQLRRSPRKGKTETTDQVDKVKLMDKYQYMVPVKALRNVLKKAKAPTINANLHIVGKLLPLVFSIEELANSRGQGLKPSVKDPDNHKQALHVDRLAAIKGYAEAWCRANNKELSDEKDINRVITDVIGYCRKKIKKELKDV